MSSLPVLETQAISVSEQVSIYQNAFLSWSTGVTFWSPKRGTGRQTVGCKPRTIISEVHEYNYPTIVSQ